MANILFNIFSVLVFISLLWGAVKYPKNTLKVFLAVLVCSEMEGGYLHNIQLWMRILIGLVSFWAIFWHIRLAVIISITVGILCAVFVFWKAILLYLFVIVLIASIVFYIISDCKNNGTKRSYNDCCEEPDENPFPFLFSYRLGDAIYNSKGELISWVDKKGNVFGDKGPGKIDERNSIIWYADGDYEYFVN